MSRTTAPKTSTAALEGGRRWGGGRRDQGNGGANKSLAADSEKKIRRLRLIFVLASLLLMLCVISTPLLLGSRILALQTAIRDEDLLESILIAILFAVAWTLFALYRRELRSLRRRLERECVTNTELRDRLVDAFRYIGAFNVQLEEIHAAFEEMVRCPESRKAFREMLAGVASKTLSGVGKDWMLIRVVDRFNLRTRIEHWQTRPENASLPLPVGNREALGRHALPGVDVVRSHGENAAGTAVIVFPLPRLKEEERILVEAIASEIELIYAVFSSRTAR